jgi:hypothetical protein
MATATQTISALAPYQPPPGLAPSDRVAHAHDYIERLQKKHATLRESLQQVKVGAQRGANTMMQTVLAVGTASSLGYVNGRYGGEKGYVAPYSMPLDVTIGGAAHVAGLVVGLWLEDDADRAAAAMPGALPRLSDILHTIGDAGLGSGGYRWAHQKGVEMAAAANAGATAAAPGPGVNGARGATYAVPQPQGR